MNNNRPDMFAQPDEWQQHFKDDILRELSNNMARDADRQQAAIPNAMADTEGEVFWDGAFPEKGDPYEPRSDLDSLSQIEDWDGTPMTDEQLLARAMDPDENVLVQNSTEYVRERDVDAQNEDLRRQLAQRGAQINNLNATYNPAWQQQRTDARNAFLEQNGLIATDDALAGRLADQMAAAQAELNMHRNERVRQSIEAQRAEYGDQAVDQAIADYMRLQGTAIGQSINDHTYASSNPGRTFLSFMHDSDVVDSLVGDQHPHMRSGRAQSRPARPSRMPRMASEQEEYSSGYGDYDTEMAIMNSAFDR